MSNEAQPLSDLPKSFTSTPLEPEKKKKRKKRKRKVILSEEEMMLRPARKQVEGPDYFEKPHVGLFNIWYSKNTDYATPEERREAKLAGPSYRVDPQKDTGFTKAKPGSYHCVYWCNGKCYRGSDCIFWHRIPNQDDEDNADPMKDIFGRERHATDREDMGGVGSFNRECKTLFISGLKSIPNLDQIIYKHFSQMGEISYLKVVEEKQIAFVQYNLRCCAEFAKQAMTDQPLDDDEILNVRWASEDPKHGSEEEQKANPAKKGEDEKRAQAWEKMKEKNPQYFAHYETLHVDGEYPNTNFQYQQQQQPQQQTSNQPKRQMTEKEKEYYANYAQSVSQGLPAQIYQANQDPRHAQWYQQYAAYYQSYAQYYAGTAQQNPIDEVSEPEKKKRRIE